jgi:RNA polymerase sigma-70 factor, ECF subfamily
LRGTVFSGGRRPAWGAPTVKDTDGSPDPPISGPESSQELLRKARSGDAAAIDRLCARYLPRLRRWAGGRLPHWARDLLDTDDLVQDTLIQTVRKMDTFEPRHEGALQAYLRQALLNRIREEVRRVRRHPPGSAIERDNPDPGPSPIESAIGREALDRYEAALKRLSEEDQQAIVLRIEMGYTYNELAEAMGKPSPDAARMAVTRALARLAEALAHER